MVKWQIFEREISQNTQCRSNKLEAGRRTRDKRTKTKKQIRHPTIWGNAPPYLFSYSTVAYWPKV